MNKLDKMLEVVGLKVGQEFYMVNNKTKLEFIFKVNKYGSLLCKDINKPNSEFYREFKFDILFDEDITVETLPFIPAQKEEYWTIQSNTACLYQFDSNNWHDFFRLSTGFCFRTKKEATANIDKFEKMMNEIRQGKRLALIDTLKD